MIQLKKNELANLSVMLNTFSEVSTGVDTSLTDSLREMQPQFDNDGYGNDNLTKNAAMTKLVDGLDCLDQVSEYALALKSGIDVIIKTL